MATVASIGDLAAALAHLRRFDLAQSWHAGMPHYPTHPPYTHSLTKLHGDFVLPNGASSAADSISLGTHTGTHIDALCHFSCGGALYGGAAVEDAQDWTAGIGVHAVQTLPLLLHPGVLLDVAAVRGEDAVPEDLGIGADLLERAAAYAGAHLGPGSVALIRTGWGRFWLQPRRFINGLQLPGVTLEGAHWLSDRGAVAVGSDTVAFERMPSPCMDVHVHLLVECGIPIMECLQLEELAAARPAEFVFLATPLKLTGATGSPLRPYALVSEPACITA